MLRSLIVCFIVILLWVNALWVNSLRAEEIMYLANEGLLVKSGKHKILFDPFFHNDYGHYHLVPEELRAKIFSGSPPFDNIDAIFVSHAHGDHFSATDFITYLNTHQQTRVYAPQQAISEIESLEGSDKIEPQLFGIELAFKAQPVNLNFGDIEISAVRIPHAGWPARADVENMVFRVKLGDELTVMHLGDADPDDQHFASYQTHWTKLRTDFAFPPYWFFGSEAGVHILEKRINAKQSIGIHVPEQIPPWLNQLGAEYFSEPGRVIEVNKKSVK